MTVAAKRPGSSGPDERRDLAAGEPARRQSLEERILQAFDREPLAPEVRGSVEGRWKTVREEGKTWVFDLWTDPMRGRKQGAPQAPAPIKPEVLEKMRKDGYW